MSRGRFIVLEGADFTGTSTHSRMLVDRLNQMGYVAVYLAEPSSGPYGRIARQSINESHNPYLTQLLFCVDRADHQQVIRDLQEKGVIIVCDRYSLSTLMYGLASGLSFSQMQALRKVNDTFIQPDDVIILNAPYKTLLERKATRGHSDRFEEDEFMKKVHDFYLTEHPHINTEADINEVHEQILARALKTIHSDWS
jgi:dTMP kinase